MSAVTVKQYVDIRVGYQESVREELITFLRERQLGLKIISLQRGMWNQTKILRVCTEDADHLTAYVLEQYWLGDDFDYEVHLSYIDAQRADCWLPDYDTEHGYQEFKL